MGTLMPQILTLNSKYSIYYSIYMIRIDVTLG